MTDISAGFNRKEAALSLSSIFGAETAIRMAEELERTLSGVAETSATNSSAIVFSGRKRTHVDLTKLLGALAGFAGLFVGPFAGIPVLTLGALATIAGLDGIGHVLSRDEGDILDHLHRERERGEPWSKILDLNDVLAEKDGRDKSTRVALALQFLKSRGVVEEAESATMVRILDLVVLTHGSCCPP